MDIESLALIISLLALLIQAIRLGMSIGRKRD